jgi:hypothetical protein
LQKKEINSSFNNCKTGNLRFSQRRWGRFVWDIIPGDWHIVTDVSERHNGSIFRVKKS